MLSSVPEGHPMTVDAAVMDGKHGIGWALKKGDGLWEKGGRAIEGMTEINEVEAAGVRIGIEMAKEIRRGRENIIIRTDSRQAIGQICNYRSSWKIIQEIQFEMEQLFIRGNRIRIEWEARGSEGNTIAQDQARRKTRQREEEEERNYELHGRARKESKKWKDIEEGRRWQTAWEQGDTGRWLYEMKKRTDGKGLLLGTKVTQALTGHGDIKGYLYRFNLTQEDGGCICGAEREDIRHVVKDCELPRRVKAREISRKELGGCPPILDNLPEYKKKHLIEWADLLFEEEGV